MTLTLTQLRERYVFESSPQRLTLGELHVPFDELVGDTRTETRLEGALRRNEPTAIIGASGSGKSSMQAPPPKASHRSPAPSSPKQAPGSTARTTSPIT